MSTDETSRSSHRVRVLSIHGGGMRGAYAAAYLHGLAQEAAARRDTAAVDIGRAFDLIVGTSTGGIIACALVAGVPLQDVVDLYQQRGKDIFPRKLPDRLGFELFYQLFTRGRYIKRGSRALREALEHCLGRCTVRQTYEARGVALAVPAVDMSNHRGWVFKTPHLGGHRDDDYALVDVCLATTAAPVFRSMAWVADPRQPSQHQVFVDGGLWANNPILVGVIDALRMTDPGDCIEVFSLGTCSRPPGDMFTADDMHRGLAKWKLGGEALAVSLDAQGYVYDQMADMLGQHLDRECHVVRFPQSGPPANAMALLDLDDASDAAMGFLLAQAKADVSLTLSASDKDDSQGRLLAALMNDMPSPEPTTA